MQSMYSPVSLSFPLWQFLTQPIFSAARVFLNPFQFQQHYYIQYLERCWDRDSIQLLERCWVAEMEAKNSNSRL